LCIYLFFVFFFFSSRRRHTRLQGDWSSDVCSSDLSASLGTLGQQGRIGKFVLQVLIDNFGLSDDSSVRFESGGFAHRIDGPVLRSEERRVGKECRSRWAAER